MQHNYASSKALYYKYMLKWKSLRGQLSLSLSELKEDTKLPPFPSHSPLPFPTPPSALPPNLLRSINFVQIQHFLTVGEADHRLCTGNIQDVETLAVNDN